MSSSSGTISTYIAEPLVGDYVCQCGWQCNSDDDERIDKHNELYCPLPDIRAMGIDCEASDETVL